jgi:glyoxylase-like metal-dependent hydrolase (beta-lactamase superfamily II)
MKDISRRDFVSTAASCAAHLALAASVMPVSARALWAMPRGPVVAREPFGSLEQVADGVWALISTPLNGDRTTISNGGLIAGRSGVLAIEGFNDPKGARRLAGKSRELTGKWPTHVALTHYHADHANGVAGYLTDGAKPTVYATAATRELVLQRNKPDDASRTAALRDAILLDGTAVTTIDLGSRTVRVVPRGGHTPSDCSLELDDPRVIFGGDLIWNGMFPNYVDAVPTQLTKSVEALRGARFDTIVPGHGTLAKAADVDRYIAMLDEVERGARAAHAKGQPAADAGAAFTLPASLGEWVLFGKVFYPRAFEAWYKELG